MTPFFIFPSVGKIVLGQDGMSSLLKTPPPTCIQRNKMTWDDDRLSFFSAFLPRYLDTLYFGSGTIIVCWLYSYISTKLKMISCWHTTLIARRGKPVMRLV